MASGEQVRRAPARPPPPQTSSRPSLQQVQPSDDEEGVRVFHDLQVLHDTAYACLDSALESDERGQTQIAFQRYSEGLRLLDQAMRVMSERLLHWSADEVEKAKMMQKKMNKTRQQVAFRLQALQSERAEADNQQACLEADAPPSYEDAVSASSMDEELMEVGDSIFSGEEQASNLTSASALFSIPGDVQIFYISPEGFVSAPSYPTSLNVVKFSDSAQVQSQHGAPPAFLHVGDWMYPLLPGASPALRTDYGAYVFPNVMAHEAGSAVGVMLPDNISPEQRMRFEQIITSFTALEEPGARARLDDQPQMEQPREEASSKGRSEEDMREEDTATKISKGIVTAAEWIAWGVGKGAEKAGYLMKVGSEKIRERTSASSKDHKVDPRVQKGVIYARQATNATVKVTGFIVAKLGEATMALAREVAPHIRKQGEKVIPKKLTQEGPKGKSTMDDVVEVAASGLKGFGTVYMGLEAAAKSLGKSLANETVQVMQHKYGNDVGNLTENTMYAAGNTFLTVYNANHLGIKAVAKRAAKDTGKAVLEDMNRAKGAEGGAVNGASPHSKFDSEKKDPNSDKS